MLHKRPEQTFTQPVYVPQGDLTLDGQEPELYAAPVGVMKSTRGFQYDQITRLVAVHVIWSGRGVMVVNGHEHRVNGGDIFIFFPGLHIRHHDFPATPWHYTWFGLHGRRAEWALAHCGFTAQHPHRPGGITPALEKHVHELAYAYREQNFPAAYPVSWAWRFITLLEQERNAPATRHRGPWLAQACRTLIESDPTARCSVKELAAQLNVERTTLFRHFREVYGTSPKSFVDAYRLQKAGELLQNTRLRVKEVAMSCGFHDPNYFCRLFRARFKLPPEQWRQTHVGGQVTSEVERP